MTLNLVYQWALFLTLILFAQCTADGQAFPEAVKRGDLGAVQRMLEQNHALARTLNDEGNTPLHLAAFYDRTEIARLLLNYGAEVNAKRHRDDAWTPLFCAAEQGKTDVARLLIEDGANITARGADGWTPLHAAAWNGSVDFIRLLLENKADLGAWSRDGNLPIHKAAQNGRLDAVRYLIARGGDLNVPNRDGNTPLAMAALSGRARVVSFLIGAGADIDQKNKDGRDCLDEARWAKSNSSIDVIFRYKMAIEERIAREAARKNLAQPIRVRYANWTNPNAQSKIVYKNDFLEQAVGPEWGLGSLGSEYAPLHISISPTGGRRYLGAFGNQTVRLDVDNLPGHKEVSVRFDLFVIGAWEGNDGDAGSQEWSLSVMEGPTLLQTTFANDTPFLSPALKIQAFPGEYPGDHNPVQSGAAEKNTLGYALKLADQNVNMDAVYKISSTFPHNGSTLLLNFSAQGLPQLSRASWGIAHIEISVASESTAKPTGKLHRLAGKQR